MKTKRCNVLIMCFLLSIVAFVQGQKHFNVIHKSGDVVSSDLKSIRSIAFSGGKVYISPYNGTPSAYDLSSITSFDFQTYTSISKPQTEISKTFFVYPNPVDNEIHIRFNSILDGILNVRIFDLQSRLVFDQQVAIDQFSNELVLPVHLSVGGYLCCISCSNHIEYIKLLKY